MGFLIAVVFFLIVAAVVVGPIILVYSRRQAREQKNFERGLKMIPLLIHLPPISEDTEANGRDVRDLMDENISKAQVIYNIIASTYEKGFKRKIYGQQHFAFEILSAQGFVYFYATVPIGLVEVVRQAVTSAYPAARLEEAEEHNIFNNAGKTAATTGGELVLKESFAYPISTYIDLKRDAMQGMLNSLASLGKEDGAAIQILLRPADPGWRKTAHSIASGKRKGEKDQGMGAKVFSGVKEVGTALVKPPEGGSGGGDDKPQLSDNEQQILNSIDEKTRYPAYEVLIRLVASSNVTQTAQSIMSNMVASFSLFDAPGKNGFKFEPAKDVDELVTSYILKFFPQDANKTILNSVELASIFHFPDQRSIPTTQLERQDSKQVDGPRNMPEEGLLLGYNVFRGVKKPIRLGIGDRQRHMYVVGQTGTGKSTFLENLALQDMLSGNGFAFVDPHGDTAEKLLSMVPRERTEDVIYFSPAEMDHPMGLNIFEYDNPDQKDFLIQEAINMLYKLYDPQHQGIMGPRYEHLFRNAALTVMADPAGGTFIDLPKLFRDPQYVKQKLQYVTDMNVKEFWQKEMPQSQRSNEFGEVVSWFVSKFGAFVSNEMMRNIIGQTKSSFNLRDIMDNKKILLVNLSKGRTGELNSKLLGMIFVMKFQAAAMSRANIPEKERVDFSLYVDEFQNFSTDSFATIMSEARKYHLNLIVANQFTTQLTEEIRDAVFGNMGTIVAFRVGQNDVDSLARYFQPTFDTDDLLRVPNYNTITRTLVGGVPTQSFSMSTLPPLGEPNAKLSAALKQLSAAKFGKPKAVVEKDIFARIATQEPVPPAGAARPFGSGAPAAGGAWPSSPAAPGQGQGMAAGASPFGAGPQQPAAARPGTGSFLDEWMAKRGTPGQTFAPTAAGPSAQGASNALGAPAGAGMPPQPMASQPFPPQPNQFAPSANPFAASPFGPAASTAQPGFAPQAGQGQNAFNGFNTPPASPAAPQGFQNPFAPAAQPPMPAATVADAPSNLISRHDKAPAIGMAGGSSDSPASNGEAAVKKKKRKKKSKSPSEMGGGSTSSLDASGGPSFGQGKLPNAEIDEDTPSSDESYLAGSSSSHDAPDDSADASDSKDKAGPHLQHKGLTIQPLSAAEKAAPAAPQLPPRMEPLQSAQPRMPAPITPAMGLAPLSPAPAALDSMPPALAADAAPADAGLIPTLQLSSEPIGPAAPSSPADAVAAPAPQPDAPAFVMPGQAADEPKLMAMPDMSAPSSETAPDGNTAPDRPTSPAEDHFSHGDTIYIDQNGNLQMAGSDNSAPAAR